MSESVKVAIVQKPPVVLDRDATLVKTVGHMDEAAGQDAQLVVFPETYVPGYPDWAWMIHPVLDRNSRSLIYDRLLANSADVDGGDSASARDGLDSVRPVV